MILDVEFFTEGVEEWPAKGARPAGRAYLAYVVDRSIPAEYRLRSMYHYRLSDAEEREHAGKLMGKTGRLAVREIVQGRVAPMMRGVILSVGAVK